jgi:hypothetical protein
MGQHCILTPFPVSVRDGESGGGGGGDGGEDCAMQIMSYDAQTTS